MEETSPEGPGDAQRGDDETPCAPPPASDVNVAREEASPEGACGDDEIAAAGPWACTCASPDALLPTPPGLPEGCTPLPSTPPLACECSANAKDDAGGDASSPTSEHEPCHWRGGEASPSSSSHFKGNPTVGKAQPATPGKVPLHPMLCTAGGKRPQESNYEHCPTPQSFVRCGMHHRAQLDILDSSDVDQLYELWRWYRDDLTYPWYDSKPPFSEEDYDTFRGIAQKVVDAMVEEYKEPMILDQATISNTNHVGHPPHADNVQFDSVWWKGKRIRREDELVAAREGAYVLWRPEKTSYRSYSCTIGLSDPDGYEGGEVHFFSSWGQKEPIARYKCKVGTGVAFCGCNRNIHAVTGVTSGFRLVLLVWTRPPNVKVPENQMHVCYFRPGTGDGVWLTTADMQKHQARKRSRSDREAWALPDVVEEKDDGCMCEVCQTERSKVAWKDCKADPEGPAAAQSSTPTTSAGNSPRECTNESTGSASGTDEQADQPRAPRHCPHPQGKVSCVRHDRIQLHQVVSEDDVNELYKIWDYYRDDLSHPRYDSKPEFTDTDFTLFHTVAQKVVDEMSQVFEMPLVLDQATISSTNHIGHPPHADNVQFDSVWWQGGQLRQEDELVAVRGGAEVLWKSSKTWHRNFSATIALNDPADYCGGALEFYDKWGDVDAVEQYRFPLGDGIAFCGCHKNIHAVSGVKYGWRMVLLVWTRPPHVKVPDDQAHVCYFRPGTGESVWLTTADMRKHLPAAQEDT